MKSLYNKFFVALCLSIATTSCDEQEFLKEVPVDRYTAENVFSSPAGIEGVMTDLYIKERALYYGGGDISYTLLFGTDAFFNARADGSREKVGVLANSFSPSTYPSEFFYQENFKIVATANLIIDNAEKSTLSEAAKKVVFAEAKFFRAKAYRDMVYLYGGVPLITKFSSTPRFDLVRAKKEDVLKQMELDFKEAAEGLPSIASVRDGRVSNIVASFYLGETLIALNRPTEAVTEILKVTTDPNVRLMTARFGTRSTVAGKDVFWDLWQRGNQNRASGNREALWVCQFETDVPGGILKSTTRDGNVLERFHVPAVWSLTDPTGRAGFLGRRTGDNVGGAGVSFLQPNAYTVNSADMPGGGIWPTGYVGDIRCNNNNLIKDAVYDNPASTFFGRSVVANRPGNLGATAAAGFWRFYPWFVKVTTPNDHPSQLVDAANPLLLSGNAGATYHDNYYLRLPEAYLLLAEAYLAAGNQSAAATAINVVRARAGATPVVAGNVTIDYILDERTREINIEEQRAITLRRVGRFGPRVVLYNRLSGPGYDPKFDLFPIPLKEIEANTGAKLEQNPGY